MPQGKNNSILQISSCCKDRLRLHRQIKNGFQQISQKHSTNYVNVFGCF